MIQLPRRPANRVKNGGENRYTKELALKPRGFLAEEKPISDKRAWPWNT
jgi:hypothetical protein